LWKANKEKFPAWTAAHPPDCLMLQGGIQLEMLTGGLIQAGMHEVILTADGKKKLEEVKKSGKTNYWRVAALLFAQISHKTVLEPLAKFRTAESVNK